MIDGFSTKSKYISVIYCINFYYLTKYILYKCLISSITSVCNLINKPVCNVFFLNSVVIAVQRIHFSKNWCSFLVLPVSLARCRKYVLRVIKFQTFEKSKMRLTIFSWHIVEPEYFFLFLT